MLVLCYNVRNGGIVVVVKASLDNEENDYQFKLSHLTEADCEEFAIKYVFKESKTVRATHINGIKVIVRDNIAKVKLFYAEEATIHEFSASLDAFGNQQANYQDEISRIWQQILARRFGKEYLEMLELKTNTILKTI